MYKYKSSQRRYLICLEKGYCTEWLTPGNGGDDLVGLGDFLNGAKIESIDGMPPPLDMAGLCSALLMLVRLLLRLEFQLTGAADDDARPITAALVVAKGDELTAGAAAGGGAARWPEDVKGSGRGEARGSAGRVMVGGAGVNVGAGGAEDRGAEATVGGRSDVSSKALDR
jgi:hypothetical protein